MAAPTLVNYDAPAGSSSGVTVTMPAGATTDDLLLLVIAGQQQDGNADAAPTGGDWALLGTGVSGSLTSSAERVTVYWAWYDAAINLVVPDAGDHTLASITAWRGVDTIEPFDEVSAVFSGDTTKDSSITITGLTTQTDEALIIAVTTSGDTNTVSGWTNANLVSITEVYDTATSAGLDGSNAMAYGELATAGATGNTTATCTSLEEEANVCIALRASGASPGGGATGRALRRLGNVGTELRSGT